MELDQAPRAYANSNAENSVLEKKVESLQKNLKASRDFINSLKIQFPGFLAGIDGLPDPSWSEEAKAKDASKPRIIRETI